MTESCLQAQRWRQQCSAVHVAAATAAAAGSEIRAVRGDKRRPAPASRALRPGSLGSLAAAHREKENGAETKSSAPFPALSPPKCTAGARAPCRSGACKTSATSGRVRICSRLGRAAAARVRSGPPFGTIAGREVRRRDSVSGTPFLSGAERAQRQLGGNLPAERAASRPPTAALPVPGVLQTAREKTSSGVQFGKCRLPGYSTFHCHRRAHARAHNPCT